MVSTSLVSSRQREGIAVRHRANCPARTGQGCGCEPRYQAQAWSARDNKPVRRTFDTAAEAVRWRQDTQVALRRGTTRAPTSTTLNEAAEDWLAAPKDGVVRTKSGHRYKPSSLRTYELALRSQALPVLGHLRLSAVSRNKIQDFADELLATGLAPSTVRNAVLPLRAIFRRAMQRDVLAINPTLKLTLAVPDARRERVARPQEAAELLAALPPAERALWAIALYAGLRRGELQALRWEDVDLANRLIHVQGSWDRVVGPISPKSRAGVRKVPLIEALHTILLEHRLRQGRGGTSFVFSPRTHSPFVPRTHLARAREAWTVAGLNHIGLHECRHTYASLMIAAGVNAKSLSVYMGHSTIVITLDRYGHLFPGNEAQAATLLDTYLTTNTAHA